MLTKISENGIGLFSTLGPILTGKILSYQSSLDISQSLNTIIDLGASSSIYFEQIYLSTKIKNIIMVVGRDISVFYFHKCLYDLSLIGTKIQFNSLNNFIFTSIGVYNDNNIILFSYQSDNKNYISFFSYPSCNNKEYYININSPLKLTELSELSHSFVVIKKIRLDI